MTERRSRGVTRVIEPTDRSASPFPEVVAADLPWLTVAEMRAVDEVMVNDLGIALEKMMENAGRNLAVLVRHLLGGSVAGKDVLVLAGPGGNGGGGLVAARHLLAAGARVRVIVGSERLTAVTLGQLATLEALEVPVSRSPGDVGEVEIVVDALLGYSQSGVPRGPIRALIGATAGRRVLSLDVPSGLELASGVLHSPAVRAEATMTLAAPKHGLQHQPAVGDLYLADIGVPPAAFDRIGRDYSTPFGRSPLVRIRSAS